MFILKRVTALIIALTIVCSSNIVGAKMIMSKSETNKYINKIAKRQTREVKNPIHGSVGGEWTVMGLARAHKITEAYKNKYKRILKAALDKSKGNLSSTAYTEYSRTVIALTSIGENPFDYYGYDVISPLAEFDKVIRQGLNGAAYALIAINSGGYTNIQPEPSYDGKVADEKTYKEVLISSSLKNGGWSMFGKKADVDMTAIAIQALSPYYNTDASAKSSIDKGLNILSQKQKNNGGFESMGNENCESCAQVLAALAAVRVSVGDKRFVKKNKTVLDGLMMYYKKSGFKHTKDSLVNQMSTDQAFYALVAYKNYLAKDYPLFNMKKVANKKAKKHSYKKQNNKKQKNSNNTKTNNQKETVKTDINNEKKKYQNKVKDNKEKIIKNNPNKKEKTNKKNRHKKHPKGNSIKEKENTKKETKRENSAEEKNSLWIIYVIVGVVVVTATIIIVYRIRRKNV